LSSKCFVLGVLGLYKFFNVFLKKIIRHKDCKTEHKKIIGLNIITNP